MNPKSKYENGNSGLYRRAYEHDACGVGMVASLSGEARHEIVENGLTILKRLMHRGATGNDPETGDGAGLLMKIPHGFFRKVLRDVFSHKGHKEDVLFGVAMIFEERGKRRSSRILCGPRAAKFSDGATCRRILTPSGTTPAQ